MRQISSYDKTVGFNDLYAGFEAIFRDALLRNPFEKSGEVQNFYTSNRVHSYPPGFEKTIRKNFSTKRRKKLKDSGIWDDLGPYELVLLDLFLNDEKPKFISLKGTVGIGKSTFLKYIQEICEKIFEPTNCIFVLSVDSFEAGGVDPTYHSIFIQLRRQATKKFNARLNLDDQKYLRVLSEESELVLSQDPDDASVISRYICDIFEFLSYKNVKCIAIFDNLDLIPPKKVENLLAVARSIWIRTHVPVVVAMRPTTRVEHYNINKEKQSFLRYRMDLSAPDLPAIIKKRLNYSISIHSNDVSVLGNTNLKISASSAEPIMHGINELILTPYAQNLLLRKLSNMDVRKALVLFDRFLRYRRLNLNKLIPSIFRNRKDDDKYSPMGNWDGHIIEAITVSSRKYYEEIREGPIQNLFYVRTPDGVFNYYLIYLVLNCLNSAPSGLKKSSVQKFITASGYGIDSFEYVIRYLLDNDMITDISDVFFDGEKVLNSTDKGKFYSEELASSDSYIYSVILDVPLAHLEWVEPYHDKFSSRLSSILELADVLLQVEFEVLEKLVNSESFHSRIIIKSFSLLSEKVVRVLSNLIHRAQDSTTVPEVASSVGKLLKVLDIREEKLERNRSKIQSLLKQNEISLGRSNIQTWRSFNVNDHVIVSLPVTTASEGAGTGFKIEVKASENDYIPAILAVINSRLLGSEQHRMLNLVFDSDRKVYFGESEFEQDLENNGSLKDTDLTLFRGGTPYLHVRNAFA